MTSAIGKRTFYIILLFLVIPNSNGSSLLSYINLEKYFFMEEELTALSGAIVEIERKTHDGSDVHGIYKHKSTIEQSKDIHLGIGSYRDYLAHPINIFHLTKRLATEWREVVTSLMKSSVCVYDLRDKLQNIEDNLPSDEEFYTIVNTVLGLQKYNGYSHMDIMNGTVNSVPSFEPVVLSDAVYFGISAYELGYNNRAISWLEFVIDNMEKDTLSVGRFSIGRIFTTLASLYLRENNLDMALEMIEELLRRDPNNKTANRNKEFFIMKKSSGIMEKKPRRMTLKSKRSRDKLCAGEDVNEVENVGRRCIALDTWSDSMFGKTASIEAVVIRENPLIVVFPRIFSNETSTNISTIGYEKMFENVITSNIYRDPKYRVKVSDSTDRLAIPIYKKLFLPKLTRYPPQKTRLEVLSIGMDGFQQGPKRGLGTTFSGTMVAALSDLELGGEIVFPLSSTKLKLRKGDVVFYEEGTIMSICPVMYGTSWYGILGIYESVPNGMSGTARRVINI